MTPRHWSSVQGSSEAIQYTEWKRLESQRLNTLKFTRKCAKSVLKKSYDNYQIGLFVIIFFEIATTNFRVPISEKVRQCISLVQIARLPVHVINYKNWKAWEILSYALLMRGLQGEYILNNPPALQFEIFLHYVSNVFHCPWKSSLALKMDWRV